MGYRSNNLAAVNQDDIRKHIIYMGCTQMFRRGVPKSIGSLSLTPTDVISYINFRTGIKLRNARGETLLPVLPDGFSTIHVDDNGIYIANVWAGTAPFENKQEVIINEAFIVDPSSKRDPLQVAATGIWRYLTS